MGLARHAQIGAVEDRAWSMILSGDPAPLPPHVLTTLPTETARVMEEAIRRRETGAEVPHFKKSCRRRGVDVSKEPYVDRSRYGIDLLGKWDRMRDLVSE